MNLKFRDDKDLEFFATATNYDLSILLDYIVKPTTSVINNNSTYKKNSPNHKKYWELIAAEIQCFGGNTLTNLFRGYGVLYKEVLNNVAIQLDVDCSDCESVEIIELRLLMKLFHDALAIMTVEKRMKVVNELELLNIDCLTPKIVESVALELVKKGGFKAYRILAVIAKAMVGCTDTRKNTYVACIAPKSAVEIIAEAIGSINTAFLNRLDIAGPAYRVTIPCVIQIAYMRQKWMHKYIIYDQLLLPERESVKNIAVIGQPGSGKSSLINKIIGRHVSEVGLRTDCTDCESKYKYMPNTYLVDFPGYDTFRFPFYEWIDSFALDKYDAFICVFEGKLHKCDQQLFKAIIDKRRRVVFVRTKTDTIWQESATNETLREGIIRDFTDNIGHTGTIHFVDNRTSEGIAQIEQQINYYINS